MNLRFSKVRKVKTPNRGYKNDAGIDLYIPTDLGWEFRQIYSHNSIVLPSGIQFNIPEGHCLVFLNKSGIAVDKGLIVGAQVIDSGYMGQLHIHLINTRSEMTVIHAGEKICQVIMLELPEIMLMEEKPEELYDELTERNKNAFGSTDN